MSAAQPAQGQVTWTTVLTISSHSQCVYEVAELDQLPPGTHVVIDCGRWTPSAVDYRIPALLTDAKHRGLQLEFRGSQHALRSWWEYLAPQGLARQTQLQVVRGRDGGDAS